MNLNVSLFERAQKIIPGGVNSPVRAFKGVGGNPLFISKAQGAYIYDSEGKSYIDYVGSWGPMILGHSHPNVLSAVAHTLENGLSFGAPTELEIKLAEKVLTCMPYLEQIRMVNSGTEATMTALRLARGFTQRDKIIKFIGCYHGHHDALLVEAGSGALTLGHPNSAGVPQSVVEHTLLAHFNDLEAVAAWFKRYPNDIAAIIVEPIAGNMGCIPATTNFIQGLRELCDRYSALLIFDEVMTGFRVALSGAKTIYNVEPDLVTLGKIIGGGLPAAAIAGKRIIMQHLAPMGPVYQAGTLSGNPLAMSAGLATLETITQDKNFYKTLEHKTTLLANGLQQAAQRADIPLVVQHVSGMISFFFTDNPVNNYHDVAHSQTERYKKLFHALLERGIYFAPSAYETLFVSIAHSEKEINTTIEHFENAIKNL